MKTLFLAITFLASTLSFAQNPESHTITVTIENFTSNEGKAVLALHTADTFMKGPGIKNLEAPIKDGKATFTFENIASGEYALLALHDKNNNNRMDYESNGMPKESYGTSNNPRSFGPPVYDDAKFKLENKDLNLTIRF